jgi:hypothetical protein
MQSKATAAQPSLDSLLDDKAQRSEPGAQSELKSLDTDYEEGIQHGMIGCCVSHRAHPAGHPCDPKQPLTFAARLARKLEVAVVDVSARRTTRH